MLTLFSMLRELLALNARVAVARSAPNILGEDTELNTDSTRANERGKQAQTQGSEESETSIHATTGSRSSDVSTSPISPCGGDDAKSISIACAISATSLRTYVFR